jgi:protein-S-isoprenylcysteine O-methyltransferase Ste14
MGGIAAFLYGVAVYAFFFATFTYAIGFAGNLLVPRSLDGVQTMGTIEAVLINLGLLSIFAVQHSLMARKSFKKWWTRIVPQAVERSTYVLFASVALAGLCWHWQPIEGTVWQLEHPAAVLTVWVVFWAGWGVLLLATFLINHFELFGLRQVWSRMTGKPIPTTAFRTPGLYKHVRHPIYLGFVMGFWATPHMTFGHLLFAGAATAYILVGIWFEERDLIATFGNRYVEYRKQVGMLLPKFMTR